MDRGKINNIIRIPASLQGQFFKIWLNFLYPFHKLTPREIDIAAEFIKQRYELGKVITDEALLDKILMNEDTKKKIRENCGLSSAHFQIVMGKLKKAKFILGDIINPKFLPKNISDEDDSFQLLLYFDLNGKDFQGGV